MSPSPSSADELYGLPLAEFTASRDALAKSLRSDGQREEAKEVAALRRPSVAAWAVNQLVRSQKREFKTLLKAGDALQQTQSDLLSGQADRDKLAAAVATERDAVDALLEKARGLLDGAGEELSPVMVERVAATLHAAALDEEARALVSGGRLTRELEHVGLGAAGLGDKGAGRRRSGAADKPAKTASKANSREELARARKAARDAGRAVRDAERQTGKLERRRDQATVARDEARQEVERAEQALREAEGTLDAQQKRLERARADAQTAEQAVQKLS